MNGIYLASLLFVAIYDIPPVQIADRYTIYSRQQIQDYLQANRQLQNKIERHHVFYPGQLNTTLEELKRLHRIYDAVDDCLCISSDAKMRGLMTLQKTIGKEAMLRMQLPYPFMGVQ